VGLLLQCAMLLAQLEFHNRTPFHNKIFSPKLVNLISVCPNLDEFIIHHAAKKSRYFSENYALRILSQTKPPFLCIQNRTVFVSFHFHRVLFSENLSASLLTEGLLAYKIGTPLNRVD